MNAMLCLSLLFSVPTAPVPSTQQLHWKLAKGDVFYSKSHVTLAQKITVLGNEQEQDQEINTFMKFKVLDADDKGYVLEETIQKYEIKGNAPGLNDLGDKMKNLTLKITMDKKFKVSKVDGLKEITEKLGGDNELTKKTLQTILTEDMIKTNTEEIFAFGPDKEVKQGQTWNRTSNYSMGPMGSMKLKNEYKLVETGDLEKVTYSSEVEFQAPKNDGELPFKITKIDIQGEEWKGDITFDNKAGRLKSGSMKGKLKGSMTISVNNMEIEAKLIQDIQATTTISDKNLADN